MENIEEKILQFVELSPDEQQAVEAYVDAHPQWRPLLEEVKALEEVRREVQLLREVDDEALAYYVVAQHFGVGASAPLQRVFDRIEARLARDPAFRDRYEVLIRRLEEIASGLDPIAQFEELSGFRVAAEGEMKPDRDRVERDAARNGRSFVNEVARIIPHPHVMRWAVAAVLVVAVLYGGLFVVSYATQTETERLALVDASEIEVEGYELNTRGSQEPLDSLSTDTLYLEALYTLREARTTTLGLFPRYDQEKLDQAEELLRHVIEREADDSFLQHEAYFFLGKVHLAQGEIEAARSNFKAVAMREGQRTDEAVQILTELEEQGLAQEQSYVPDNRLR